MCDLNNMIPFISPCWYKESPWWALGDAFVTILSVLIVVFGTFKYWSIIKNWYKVWRYSKDNCIVVFGLGENNRTYIDSEINDNKILIIEQNKENLYVQNYIGKNAVKIADASNEEILKSLNLQNKKHIVISLGDDMTNLEITTQILNIAPKTKIYVHIEDRSLRHFHKEGGLLEGSNIKVFSYYEDTSRALFENYDIDGKSHNIIQSSESFSIVVVGNTNLAYEVISQACIMGQLPNENKLTIYCIDKNLKEFKQSIDLNYTEIDNVPNVELKYLELDCNSKEFYTQDIWYEKNLTNIILCFNEEQLNLDIAANLANITYLEPIANNTLKTKVLIGIFNDYNFSQKLKSNSKSFLNFEVFGQKNEICDKKYLIDEKRDQRAVATNLIYNNITPSANKDSQEYKFIYKKYTREDSKIVSNEEVLNFSENGWNTLSYFLKESNRANADHLKTKLKFLGLEMKEKKDEKFESLYLSNRKLYGSMSENQFLMAKNEHNRWNTFYYLNGYKQIDFISQKDKKLNKEIHELKKVHMCLIKDYSDFKKNEIVLQELGYSKWQFEGYDYMINYFIPFIVAYSGYKLQVIKNDK